MKRLRAWLCVLMVLACASPAGAIVYYGDFDWRQNGGNYVTPIRNQGGLGSCWAFSAVAALESQFLINAGTPGMNLDLSEQHLVCDSSTGMGGHENLALSYIVSLGITDEATLPYLAQPTSPLWPVERPYTVYKTDAVTNYCTGSYTTTSEIKSWLTSTGPLSCAIYTGDWFDPATVGAEGAAGSAMDFSLPEWLRHREDPGPLGPDDPVGAINHSVCIVGYKDVPSMSSGGYWIIKNSWGSNWGDSGYGFMEYGDVEKYNRIHAVTGATYTVVEPSRAPVAADDAYVVNEDERMVGYRYQGVLVNDTDINTPHDELTSLKITDPEHGTVTLGSTGWITYTPDEDYSGPDSFTYMAYDGQSYSDPATVNLDIVSINDVPVAVDDAYSVEQNSVLNTYGY
ncbi:MAG: cadherin-like domain-containing protein, partial [Pirellulales bacterium]|nr:cadherin-like domain-containing protein [Pirellulales bacterium]